jgi:CHAD domain-containing protein
MPFRFKRKERVSEAIRRLTAEQIDKSLRELRQADKLEAIHSVRKNIKKVRAILRLVRTEMRKKSYREYKDSLRQAADYLGGARDAHVKLQALETLISHHDRKLGPRPFLYLKRVLRENCLKAAAEFSNGKSIRAVDRILRRLSKEFLRLSLKESGWVAVAQGIENSYRLGRKTMAKIRRHPADENFHEWRKRVKDLWYQVRLLCPISPEEMRALAQELKTLADRLGDDHDLVMLKQAAEEVCLPEAARQELTTLQGLIGPRQRELRSAALRLGRRVYLEKPEVLSKKLESWWHTWHR